MKDIRICQVSDFIQALEQERLLVSHTFDSKSIETVVGYLSYDSSDVQPQTMFVCKGAHFKVDYLVDAIYRGSIGYISQETYNLEPINGVDVPYIIVNDIRNSMAVLANLFYNKVWNRLSVIGITGTKGKSTTAYFMKAILDDYLKTAKKPASAIISGIDNYDGVIKEESHLTTPEAIMLHRHMDNAVKSGIEYLTMEVSSQGLKYHRLSGIIYDVGCFLNLGTDHISDIEHKDLADYGNSKRILFNQSRNAVINLDSDFAGEVLETAIMSETTERIFTFGTLVDREPDLLGYDITPAKKGITFKAKCDSFDEEFKITITGMFNVSNALGAIAMAYMLRIPLDNIKNGLKKAKVSGRMEIFTTTDESITVLVDYAHNQMSFQSLFQSMAKEYPDKKIIIVYGCPGKKALGRRKELGEITGKYADLSIITEEDGGEESVQKISEEIATHIAAQGGEYLIIPGREAAIKKAIDLADENTIVLVTGKGRETRQKRGVEYIDTPSDVDYVEKFLIIKEKEMSMGGKK